MIPLQKLVVSLDEAEARLFRDCCYSISEVSLVAGGVNLWDYKTVEDAWAFANNWNLLKGNHHAFDHSFGQMENWVRRVGQGYRERDVLLGKREEVDRYIVNLIHETRSKVTKKILRENAHEEMSEEQQIDAENTISNGHPSEERERLQDHVTGFTSNFSDFESRDHHMHEDAYSHNVRLQNPFEHNPRSSVQHSGDRSVVFAKLETAGSKAETSVANSKDAWKLKGSQLSQPETASAKQLLPLESDSEEPAPPREAFKTKETAAVERAGEEETPASPVPSIAFSDLEHAPSFIL